MKDDGRPEEAETTVLRPGRPIGTGNVLNDIFIVGERIGGGGMGDVFDGRNRISGERVAIKIIRPSLADDPQVVEMFRREADTLTRLQHEAIVSYRVLAEDSRSRALYLVMAFVEGTSLGELLGTIAPAPDELARLLRRLASGLAAAHARGAVHRDMSPDNVIVSDGKLDEARIIDFGIAKDMSSAKATIIGDGFAGKLGYVAPEQLGMHGGGIGPWTDVYSLALVILAVASGRPADMGGTIAEAVAKRGRIPKVDAVPDTLRPLLCEMLRPDPSRRLQSMPKVVAAVDALLATRPTRRRRWPALAAAGAFAAAAAAGWWLGEVPVIPIEEDITERVPVLASVAKAPAAAEPETATENEVAADSNMMENAATAVPQAASMPFYIVFFAVGDSQLSDEANATIAAAKAACRQLTGGGTAFRVAVTGKAASDEPPEIGSQRLEAVAEPLRLDCPATIFDDAAPRETEAAATNSASDQERTVTVTFIAN